MYTFNAGRFGRDITETATTPRGIANILAKWLVWDEGGGLMRCAPDNVTYNGVEVLNRNELYAYSHGQQLAILRRLFRRVKTI